MALFRLPVLGSVNNAPDEDNVAGDPVERSRYGQRRDDQFTGIGFLADPSPMRELRERFSGFVQRVHR